MSWGNFSLRISKHVDRRAIQEELNTAHLNGKSVHVDEHGMTIVSGLTEEEAAQALEYMQHKGLNARTSAPKQVQRMSDLPMKKGRI